MRRDARRHETVASQQNEAGTEIYWEYRPNQAVMTIDGPGRVTAVYEGPFPGSEEYEVALNGGLGGGRYASSQIVSGAHTEASTTHTAAEDYPELGNLLQERPDPATMRYTASLDPTSKEYEDRWGFRQPTPEEKHASLIEDATDTRDHLHEDAADRGHDMEWTPENHGRLGYSPAWLGQCRNCGAAASASAGGTSVHQLGRDAREGQCSGAGTAWQNDMVSDLAHDRMGDVVSQFGQDVKDNYDREWLHGQGLHPTASLTASDTGGMSAGGLDGMTSGTVHPTTAPEADGVVAGDPQGGQVAWDPGMYNETGYHSPDWRLGAISHPDGHPGKVYLRFGNWPKDERSNNNITGHKEDGVSVYDLDHKGDPMDPDPGMDRGVHEHDDYCDEHGCDQPEFDEDYGNDPAEEMRGRAHRAENAHRHGYSTDHPDTGHLVKGNMVGIGHDGEPLLNNVEKVGNWIDHRHHFIPGAEAHHLARHPDDEDYEPYEGEPKQLKLFEASKPDDGDPDLHKHDPAEWTKEGGFCHVGHPGSCRYEQAKSAPEYTQDELTFGPHTAMPSRSYPDHPVGFNSELGKGSHFWGASVLNGYQGDKHVGSIEHTAYDRHGNAMSHDEDPTEATHLKVHMLRGGGTPGAASALMDHLYSTYPTAMINHGHRTEQGLRWWNSYEEPDENRNVHNVHPDHWDHMFDRSPVAADIHTNENNDPGHHSDHHDIDWAHDHDPDDEDSDKYCDHCNEYGHDEDKHPTCENCGEIGHDEDDQEYHPVANPDPTDATLHHGTSVRLSPEAHSFVHNPAIPHEDRAHRLLDEIGRGNMPAHGWQKDEDEADHQALQHGRTSGTPHTQHSPATHVVLHSLPFEHDEVHDSYGDPSFTTDGRSAAFDTKDAPVNHYLDSVSWGEHHPGENHHEFEEPEAVGMPISHDGERRLHPNDVADRARTRQKHEDRYAPSHDLHPSGTAPWHGEQQRLFASKVARSINGTEIDRHGTAPHEVRADHPNSYDARSTEGEPDPEWIDDIDRKSRAMASVLSHLTMGPKPEARHDLKSHLISHHGFTNDQLAGLVDPGQHDDLIMEHELEHDGNADNGISGEFGRGEIDGARVEHDHKGNGLANRFPESSEFRPYGTPQGHYLSMLHTAVQNESFRFHFTAAWRDVQSKAVRIRKSGGVNITHVSDGLIIANVKGDHHVYETGLQRYPGRRTAVAVYSCGCKWGAYHWGADDDMSRFAGRMCSHALALQYEAQSKGMFGRDITVEDTKPQWVPSKVIVKYDIDDGRNIRAVSKKIVPEQSPFMILMASVNDMFGDATSYTEPAMTNPLGPTSPPNPTVNPTSAGPFTTGEPDNWGSIGGPTILPGVTATLTNEAFIQALIPLVKAIAPTVLKAVAPAAGMAAADAGAKKVSEVEGAQADLHDEPEGALPSTDGDEHTASMNDTDLTGGSGIGGVEGLGDDGLSPEDPSIQTMGGMGTQDIVAAFQTSAAASGLMMGTPSKSDGGLDIATAAREHLSKLAGTSFSAAEQHALIHESPGVQASNTDRLDIAGTHYAELDKRTDSEDDYSWLM